MIYFLWRASEYDLLSATLLQNTGRQKLVLEKRQFCRNEPTLMEDYAFKYALCEAA